MSFKGLYNVNKTRMIALLCLEVLTSALSIGVSYINTYQITALKDNEITTIFYFNFIIFKFARSKLYRS